MLHEKTVTSRLVTKKSIRLAGEPSDERVVWRELGSATDARRRLKDLQIRVNSRPLGVGESMRRSWEVEEGEKSREEEEGTEDDDEWAAPATQTHIPI